MSFRGKAALIFLVAALAGVAPAAAADPFAELGKFSVFEHYDLGKVSGGKVVQARGPALEHARDLAIQFLYLVPAPLAKTVERHRQFDPSRHPELKVILHGDLPVKPATADFAKAGSPPANAAVKALIAATQKLPQKGDLQLSSAEATDFSKPGAGSGPLASWTRVLQQRAAAFTAKGLVGLPPYEAKQPIRPVEEATRLLKEQPKIRAQFSGLIEATPLGGSAGTVAPGLYWELFDVDGTGAYSLGAAYAKEGADSSQMADLQYYASGGYYVYFSLYQMWQVTVDGQQATLVWRGDSIASQALGELRGVEKMGSGAAMMAEVKKAITLFLKETGK